VLGPPFRNWSHHGTVIYPDATSVNAVAASLRA
jgi:hypothetical protein